MAATQQEIAASLGLSNAAVSLALQGHPRISQATRLRVEAKARELGCFERLTGILRARGIEGLLLPPSLPQECYDHPTLAHFAVVMVNPDASAKKLDQVRQNHDEALRLIFGKIRDSGYRRPAMAFVHECRLPDYGESALAFDRLRGG